MAKPLIGMTRSRVVARAKSAIGRPTRYKLGAGGRAPSLKLPDIELDCSGFVAWALGVDRYLPNGSIPYIDNGAWFECTNVFKDALSPYGFVAHVDLRQAVAGDLLVWPDRGSVQGHIGIITSIDSKQGMLVTHCSSGNFKKYGDAIQETDAKIFLDHGAIAAAVSWLEVRA